MEQYNGLVNLSRNCYRCCGFYANRLSNIQLEISSKNEFWGNRKSNRASAWRLFWIISEHRMLDEFNKTIRLSFIKWEILMNICVDNWMYKYLASFSLRETNIQNWNIQIFTNLSIKEIFTNCITNIQLLSSVLIS